MNKKANPTMSFFDKFLTIWVLLCMIIGVLIGKFIPVIPDFLKQFTYEEVSIPIAILIWIMIYPMMLKVDFKSVKTVGENPKGLFITWIVNWLIKPFTMFGIASFFFYIVFKNIIPEDLAKDYLIGAVLLGAAPCTAMVFVWSHLCRGNSSYTVVQVATNDLIILVAFVPIVGFLLGVSDVVVPINTLIISVILFVVVPLVSGVLTRTIITKNKGSDYFENIFVKKFSNSTIIGLLLTLDYNIFFSRSYDFRKTYSYNFNCNSINNTDFLDFFHSIWSCKIIKITIQYRSTLWHDWCVKLF